MAGDADQALGADGAHFDPGAVLGLGQDRIDRIERKMDVTQRVSGPLGHVADRAEVDLDVRQQSVESVAVEGCEHGIAVQIAQLNLRAHSSKLLDGCVVPIRTVNGASVICYVRELT
ncbi:hypothetical protein MTY66_29720 [Mycolicibacterium sp. TY66]|nr:hypothetical protein MTY66_29720 [Mycolicibacterium sp. TY66]BCJ80992.1 hypothetical protein MTY81_23650 [Mycolicibacterium sp. TY81]